MDSGGIDLQVISHLAPAAQGHAGPEGLARAREANDQLAAAVRAHPDRFAGFATFSIPPVRCTVQVLGVDRVLFSVDYPFGSNAAGRVRHAAARPGRQGQDRGRQRRAPARPQAAASSDPAG